MSGPAAAAITDLARTIPAGATVIAVTDDGTDPRYASVRAAAARIAARVGGRVLSPGAAIALASTSSRSAGAIAAR